MNSPTASTRFEIELRAALATPNMRPEFRQQLRQQLHAAAQQNAPTKPLRWRRSLRAAFSVALALLVLAVLALGPQRVLAQVLDWLGYVPGVGFVQTEGGLRVLEAPVSIEREGITLTAQQGLIDDQSTRLSILFVGIRPEQIPTMEDSPGCFAQPSLRLPDGRELAAEGAGGSSGHTWWQLEITFPTIPMDVMEVTLVVPCVHGTLEGSAPEDWQLDLRFVLAPADFEVLPVLPLPLESGVGEAEANQQAAGMQLAVERLLELDGGYLFQLRFSWTGLPYEYIQLDQHSMSLVDAAGLSIPFEVVYDDIGAVIGSQSEVWTVRTQTRQIATPVNLSLPRVSLPQTLEEAERPVIELDLGDKPQDGQVWPLDQTIQVLGQSILVEQASFRARGDGSYWINLEMRKDPDIVASVSFSDADNQSQYGFGGGGGSGDGHITQSIGYDYLPQGARQLQLAAMDLVLQGPWEVSVDLPDSAGSAAEEDESLAACITQESYMRLAAEPTDELPVVASGRVLVQDFSTTALLPRFYLAGLDDSDRQDIDIGSWGALSPDGRYLAYAHDGLRVVDLESGQSSLLITEDSSYAMAWSPDGSRLAFIRGGQGLFLINANGSELKRAPGSSPDMIGVAGWLPGGQRVVVASIAPEGTRVQTVDLGSGLVMDNFVIDNRKGGFARLSPDGARIAFSEHAFGVPTYSVFVANLDGTEKRLLAESGSEIAFMAGVWSPDGQWLILNATEVGGISAITRPPALAGLVSCHVYLLDRIAGEIVGWLP